MQIKYIYLHSYNYTILKDAIFGLLLAIEMMAVTGKNLSEYLKDLMDEFGYYYPDRSGISVDPTLVGEPLIKKISVIEERYKKGLSFPWEKQQDCEECDNCRRHKAGL